MTIKFSIDLHGMYSVTEYIRIAKLVESYGFDEIHVVDDLGYKPAWPTLALIASNTSRIKLGPWLVAPRIVHPAYHAANLAEIDEISNGRAVFCLGRGGFMDMLGLEEAEKPLTMMRESIALIRHLFAAETHSFEGKVFRARHDMGFRFKTLRSNIPLMIGTFGPQTAKMAGEIADGILVSCVADHDYFQFLVKNFDAGAAEAGRDSSVLEKAVSPLCCISSKRDDAFDLMRRKLPNILKYLSPLTEHAGIKQADIPHNDFNLEALDPSKPAPETSLTEDQIRFFSTVGTPSDVIPQVEGMIDAGANHIAFSGMLGPDVDEAIKLIATEVMPRFR
jgi:5,10-methylenetetrahydromethanopterin reductase